MKTDAETDERGLPVATPGAQPTKGHLPQAFDIGRLDNEVEPPKVLLDVIHVGVAIWGLILAAGVYFFGGGDWRESLLVVGVFAFFLGAWRIAMFVGARRKRRVQAKPDREAAPGRSRSVERGETPSLASADPSAETRPVDRSAESTAAEREYVSRSS